MIELRTLGTVTLRTSVGAELRGVLRRPKRLAFLVYLAANAPRLHSRDTLQAMFWPECDQTRARLALRQTLHVLRRELGREALANHGSALVGVGEGALWCDAVAFEDACDRSRLVEALELYRGEFLPGFFVQGAPDFERWMEGERARLRDRACWAAWLVAEECELRGASQQAAYWGRRAVAFGPDDEASVRRLMALLARVGDRIGAVRLYGEFARRIALEYEVQPSRETRELVGRIRGDCPAERPGAAGAAADAAASDASAAPMA